MAIVALPATAQATNPPPRLTWIGTPTFTLGADGIRTLSVPFSAVDDGPSGLSEVGMEFELVGSSSSNLALDGIVVAHWNGTGQSSVTAATAGGTMRKWVPSGTYAVRDIDVIDRAGNRTTYFPGGTDTSEPSGPVADPFDWSKIRFTVNNPDQDIQPPHLTSLGVFEKSVVAGEPVVVLYTAIDDVSGVGSTGIEYVDVQGHVNWAQAEQDVAAVGPATWLIPLSAIGGNYRVVSIFLTDNEGNTMQYSGSAGGGSGPVNGIDPDAADFDVTAVTPDSTVPTMSSLKPLSKSTLHPGDEFAFDFTAFDDLTGITELTVDYVNGDGVQGQWWQHCGDLTHGPVSVVLPSYAATGKWTINDVAISDGAGNMAIYAADGTVNHQPSGATAPATLSLPVSSLSFTVSPGASAPWPVPSGSTLGQGCGTAAAVGVSVPAVSETPGAGLSVTAHVSRAGASVSQPVTATYSAVGRQVHLLGVARGSSTGHTSTATTLAATTGYFVRFFGQARGTTTVNPARSATATVRAVTPGEVIGGLDSHRRLAVRLGPTRRGETLSGVTVGGSSAVVSAAHRNFWFAVTSTHRIYVRDDWSTWRPLTTGGAACATVSAAALGGSLAIACDGTDHHLRTAWWPLSTITLPAVRAWTDRGVHPGSGATLWSDGKVVRAAVSTASGVIARTLGGHWSNTGAHCTGQPAVAVSGGQTYLACTDASKRVNLLRHRSYGWANWKTGLVARGLPALTARPDGTAGLWLVGTDGRCRGITLTSSTARGRWTLLPGSYLSGTTATYGVA
ncbi:MAG: hypothetical protein QOC82_1386 [Frankiaceae bacterium]|nr:hypothetical protein [Frankiaceae bacterium]